MIVVEARIKVNPGKREAFIEAAQPVIAATRKEQGNICYELYASTEDENLLLYFERWENRDNLKAHMESAHMKGWVKTKEELGLTPVPSDVRVYDVAE